LELLGFGFPFGPPIFNSARLNRSVRIKVSQTLAIKE